MEINMNQIKTQVFTNKEQSDKESKEYGAQD